VSDTSRDAAEAAGEPPRRCPGLSWAPAATAAAAAAFAVGLALLPAPSAAGTDVVCVVDESDTLEASWPASDRSRWRTASTIWRSWRCLGGATGSRVACRAGSGSGVTARLPGKDLPIDVHRRGVLATPPPGLDALDAGEGVQVLVAPGGGDWRCGRDAALDLPVWWRYARDGDTYLKVRWHFIHERHRGPLYRASYGKVYRKLRELAEGTVYRFGREVDMVETEYQILPMRTGDVVAGRPPGRSHPGYATGSYAVRVEVVRKNAPERRRITISDVPLPGVPIGRLSIE
jgi:hypothetical protein